MRITATLIIALFCVLAPSLQAQDELAKSASWDWPSVSAFEAHLESYLEQNQASEEDRQNLSKIWSGMEDAERGPELLQRLLDSASVLDPRIAQLNKQLNDPGQPPIEPGSLDWLASDVPGWLQDTIRLACGRGFAQRKMYDEALAALTALELSQVCDPSSLIFYRATSEHHLMRAEECLADVELLLERKSELPQRFAQLAELMLADISKVESDSLDEVSRLMRDVERRLDLGRAGKRVRNEEQEIVDKLDKLIKDIEQQMQQQQQQQQQQAQQNQSQQGMQDSEIADQNGPGDVDKKDQGERSGWGNLPPAERQESLQRLTEELPTHYRDVIEGYFRQLSKAKK
ncbi:MAG: hypothetical protein AB8B50_08945 [Pirellulaceae bacterium]